MDKKYHISYDYFIVPNLFDKIYLFQLGRLYCKPGAIIPEHPHVEWFELTIVTEGKGQIFTDGNPMDVSKGDIYISFPDDYHKIVSSDTEPLKYDFFSFKCEDTSLKEALEELVLERKSFDMRIIKSPEISYFVSSAIAEFYGDAEYRERMLCLLFEEIVLSLLRKCKQSKDENKKTFKNSVLTTEELCYQIMRFIDNRLYSINTLSDLSEEMGYQYAYLSHIFKECTGNTISDYYQNRRLTTAKMLIEEGRVNFSLIAQMLNYSSLYSFSRAFKKRFGISPKEFKEMTKSK